MALAVVVMARSGFRKRAATNQPRASATGIRTISAMAEPIRSWRGAIPCPVPVIAVEAGRRTGVVDLVPARSPFTMASTTIPAAKISSCGSVDRRCLSVDRFAVLISRVAHHRGEHRRTLGLRGPAMSSTRCNAPFIAVPVDRVGGWRIRSSSEYRLPSSVFSVATRSPGNAGSARRAAFATVACSRFSAMARTSETCRASTLTPGNSTRCRRSQPTE